MTRRWAAAVISVVLGAVIAGCSNDSADPVTVAASASSRPTPTPSVAAISTAPPTSSGTAHRQQHCVNVSRPRDLSSLANHAEPR